MHAMLRQRFLQQYAQTSVQTGVENAKPHRLVQMLYEGALDRIAQAKGAILRKDIEAKANLTNRVMDIITYLQSSLELEKGGEVAENLYRLYDYMNRQVFAASRDNDSAKLEEVAALIREVKSAWDQMPEEYKRLSKDEIVKLAPQ